MSDVAAVASMVASAVVTIAWRRAAPRTMRGDVAAAALLVAVAATALLAMGRPPAYQQGRLRVWSGNVDSDQSSQQIADPYTFTHVTHGVAFYGVLRLLTPRWPLAVRAVAAIATECAWEVVENTDAVIGRYRAATIARGYYGDSVVNTVGDIAASGVGFAIAAVAPISVTIVLTVANEVALALWIRDGLLLNLLMLLWPLDAVRAWQRRG